MIGLRGCTALAIALVSGGASIATAHAEDAKKEPEPKKHYLRAAIEEALALAGGTSWYWLDRNRQVADWDFPSWSERLSTDVIRYDNNPFHVNFAWHAGNGASFHTIGRVNGLSLWESMGAGALTSLAWEYALEYREKVSLNDLLLTTGAGIPLGEFLFDLGRYVHEDKDASRSSLARWTAGFPMALTRAMNGEGEPAADTTTPGWHAMHVAYEFGPSSAKASGVDVDHTLHSLHLDGAIVRLPGYLQRGVWSTGFSAGEFTKASMDISGASGGSAVKIFANTTLFGWYSQQVHADPRFLSNAVMVGASMAYRYRREQIGNWDDRVAVFHMPGLEAQGRLQWREFSLDASLSAHPDFAGVNAPSYEAWAAAHPDEQGKAILRKMGYYYGYGASVSAFAELRYRSLALGGSLFGAEYHSDEGLDRTQEDVTTDQSSSDTILDGEVHLRLEGLPHRGYVGARLEARGRDSTLEEFSTSSSLRRLSLRVGLAF